MSEEPVAGEGADGEVPEAVRQWLSAVAADRGVSETELLTEILTGQGAGADDATSNRRELDRFEQEFRSLIEDVRERVIQVKREADGKAPADHTHHDLSGSLDQLGREVGALETEMERLDERLTRGFENYEDILTYLTDTTDELNQRVGRLASAVVNLRERVDGAVRDEGRRVALAHLAETANRHGVTTAKCGDCDAIVDVSLLLTPECPHCDAAFSALEPKRGLFRKSVLHTGTPPALESGEPLADELAATAGREPDEAGAAAPAGKPEATATADTGSATTDELARDDGRDGPTTPEPAAGSGDLQSIDGVGPAYAGRLQEAGVDGIAALARADPDALGEAIDVPSSRVADWIEQAESRVNPS